MNYLMSYLRLQLLFVLLLVTNSDGAIHVLSQINRFDEAPPLALRKLTSPGGIVELQNLDRPVVLIFGELYNERTLECLKELKKAYEAIGLTEAGLSAFLIISHETDPEQTALLQGEGKIKVEILLDKDLKAFSDYGIVVLPSTVVIDKQHRVDLAVSGLPLSFADMMADALLLSTGRITPQQYEAFGHAAQKAEAQQESVAQAHRVANLAGQLTRRGYTSLAMERYREALEIDKSYLPARVGTARCFVKLNLLLEATDELQRVLDIDPNHIEANLVISQIEIMRGGDGIAEGKSRLQRLLMLNPDHPEANYLMGMACEAQGQVDRAMDYYKKAARRLLETGVN